MATPPQGIFTFPGIEHPISGTFTLGHGIAPSVCQIEYAPQAGFIAASGTLSIRFGTVNIQFQNCRAVSAQGRRSRDGRIWTIAIQDRRWKWKFGKISGHYNERNASGELLIAGTEKTPRELAKLCLDEMQEAGVNLNAIPNDSRPEVDWVASNPAQALADLCDSLGCRIMLGYDNKVKICKLGVGAQLPQQDAMSEDFTFDPPEMPDKIELIGGPTKYQCKFVLEPVGKNTDGSIVPIDDLDYTPTGGWGVCRAPEVGYPEIDDPTDRRYAEETVYRWYRIVAFLDRYSTQEIRGFAKFRTLKDIILDDVLVETSEDPDTHVHQAKPAVVTGIYQNGELLPRNTKETEILGFSDKGSLDNRPTFSIDKDRQIVKFQQPIYQVKDPFTSQAKLLPARIYLETSFSLRDEDTRAEKRYSREKNLGGRWNTGNQIIQHDELVRTYRVVYDEQTGKRKVSIEDNEITDQIRAYADGFLTAAALEYQNRQPADRPYAGFKKIELDGAIQQVTWSFGPQGATTRASRDNEHAANGVPTYKDRRIRDKTIETIEDAKNSKRRPK